MLNSYARRDDNNNLVKSYLYYNNNNNYIQDVLKCVLINCLLIKLFGNYDNILCIRNLSSRREDSGTFFFDMPNLPI